MEKRSSPHFPRSSFLGSGKRQLVTFSPEVHSSSSITNKPWKKGPAHIFLQGTFLLPHKLWKKGAAHIFPPSAFHSQLCKTPPYYPIHTVYHFNPHKHALEKVGCPQIPAQSVKEKNMFLPTSSHPHNKSDEKYDESQLSYLFPSPLSAPPS